MQAVTGRGFTIAWRDSWDVEGADVIDVVEACRARIADAGAHATVPIDDVTDALEFVVNSLDRRYLDR